MYLLNKVRFVFVLTGLLIFTIFSGCKPDQTIWEEPDRYVCKTNVEFPMGSNLEPISGKRVSFLPNILSLVTIRNVEQSDSIFYWCISDYVPIGRTLDAKPLCVLKFRQEGRIYNMVILNTVEEEHNVLQVKNMEQMATEHYAALLMLQDWFLHTDPSRLRSFVSWEDEWYAVRLINAGRSL